MSLSHYKVGYEPIQGDHIKTVSRTLTDLKREQLASLKNKPTVIKPCAGFICKGMYFGFRAIFSFVVLIGTFVETKLHEVAFGK